MCKTYLGPLSAPTSVFVLPVLGWIQHNATVTWRAPVIRGNNRIITYRLSVCHVLTETCRLFNHITAMSADLGDLLAGSKYNYTLTSVKSNGSPGGSASGLFFTLPKEGISLSIYINLY